MGPIDFFPSIFLLLFHGLQAPIRTDTSLHHLQLFHLMETDGPTQRRVRRSATRRRSANRCECSFRLPIRLIPISLHYKLLLHQRFRVLRQILQPQPIFLPPIHFLSRLSRLPRQSLRSERRFPTVTRGGVRVPSASLRSEFLFSCQGDRNRVPRGNPISSRQSIYVRYGY